MATLSKVSSNGNHKFTLTVVRNSSDVAANTSNITATFKISPQTTNAYGWNYASGSPVTYTIKLDGKSYTGTILKYTKNSTATIRTITVDVPHNVDGSKSITYGFDVTSLSGNILPGTASTAAKETLTRINRASTFTANGTWYIGHTKKYMTVTAYDNSFYHKVTYSMGSASGSLMDNDKPSYVQGGGSYYLRIPAELGNEIPNTTLGALGVKLETFYLDEETGEFVSIGSSNKVVTVYIDKEASKPYLSPYVNDINVETTYLTGDDTVLIKGYSTAKAWADVIGYNGASITNVAIKNDVGGKKEFTGAEVYSVEYPKVEDGNFKFWAKDSRGLQTEAYVTSTMIDYVPLTVNKELTRPNGEGVMDMRIYGNYWNGNFGAHDNVLILHYRYFTYDDEGYLTDSSGWIPVSAEDISINDDFTYEANVTLTVPDYTKKWTFEARASDMLRDWTTDFQSVKAFPLFDWSENDFNFNVPVKFSYEGGTTSTALVGMATALSNVYNFGVTSTNGTGWTVTAKTAALIGGQLRFSFNATRSTSLAAGNNANEDIGSFTITHGGKLAQAGNTSFISGATGPVCSFVTTGLSLGDEDLTFTVQLAANSHQLTQVGGFVILPVALNLEAFATTLGEEDIPDEAAILTLELDDEPSEDITIV